MWRRRAVQRPWRVRGWHPLQVRGWLGGSDVRSPYVRGQGLRSERHLPRGAVRVRAGVGRRQVRPAALRERLPPAGSMPTWPPTSLRVRPRLRRRRLLEACVPQRLLLGWPLPRQRRLRMLPRPQRRRLLTAVMPRWLLWPRPVRQRRMLVCAGVRGRDVPATDVPHALEHWHRVQRPRRVQGDDMRVRGRVGGYRLLTPRVPGRLRHLRRPGRLRGRLVRVRARLSRRAMRAQLPTWRQWKGVLGPRHLRRGCRCVSPQRHQRGQLQRFRQ